MELYTLDYVKLDVRMLGNIDQHSQISDNREEYVKIMFLRSVAQHGNRNNDVHLFQNYLKADHGWEGILARGPSLIVQFCVKSRHSGAQLWFQLLGGRDRRVSGLVGQQDKPICQVPGANQRLHHKKIRWRSAKEQCQGWPLTFTLEHLHAHTQIHRLKKM